MIGKILQPPYAATVPISVVLAVFSSLSGQNVVDFDEADFAALPRHCQISASFGVSRCLSDIESAVETAWPYPVGSPQFDALVVVHANGMDMGRYREIQRQLQSKLHAASSLFVSVRNFKALPAGMVSITILAIAHPGVGADASTHAPVSHHHSGG